MLPENIEHKLESVAKQIIARGKDRLIPDKEKFAYDLLVKNFPGEKEYAKEILHEIVETMGALRESGQIKRIESKHPNTHYTLQEALQEIINERGIQVLDNSAVCRHALQFFVLFRNFSPETVEFLITLIDRSTVSKIIARAQRTPVYDKQRFATAFYAEYHKNEEPMQDTIEMIAVLLDVLEKAGKIQIEEKPTAPSSLKEVLQTLVKKNGVTILDNCIAWETILTQYQNYSNELGITESDLHACFLDLVDKQMPAKILHIADTIKDKEKIAFLAYQAFSANVENKDEAVLAVIVLLIDVLTGVNSIKTIKIAQDNSISNMPYTLPMIFEKIVEEHGLGIFDDERALSTEMQYYLFYQKVTPLVAESLKIIAKQKIIAKAEHYAQQHTMSSTRKFALDLYAQHFIGSEMSDSIVSALIVLVEQMEKAHLVALHHERVNRIRFSLTEAIEKIIIEYGVSVLDDSQKCRGLLKDYTGDESQEEISELMEVIALGFHSFSLTAIPKLISKKPTVALSLLDTLIKQKAATAVVYNNRGLLLFEQGKHKKAIDDFQQAINRNSNDPTFYYNLGQAYLATDDSESAIKALETAFQLAPLAKTIETALQLAKERNAEKQRLEEAMRQKKEQERIAQQLLAQEQQKLAEEQKRQAEEWQRAEQQRQAPKDLRIFFRKITSFFFS